MTPAEFKLARQTLGLSADQAAMVLDYGARSRIYELEGGTAIPARVERLMRLYLAGVRPDDWPT